MWLWLWLCREPEGVPLHPREGLGLQEVHSARLPARQQQRPPARRQAHHLLRGAPPQLNRSLCSLSLSFYSSSYASIHKLKEIGMGRKSFPKGTVGVPLRTVIYKRSQIYVKLLYILINFKFFKQQYSFFV